MFSIDQLQLDQHLEIWKSSTSSHDTSRTDPTAAANAWSTQRQQPFADYEISETLRIPYRSSYPPPGWGVLPVPSNTCGQGQESGPCIWQNCTSKNHLLLWLLKSDLSASLQAPMALISGIVNTKILEAQMILYLLEASKTFPCLGVCLTG